VSEIHCLNANPKQTSEILQQIQYQYCYLTLRQDTCSLLREGGIQFGKSETNVSMHAVTIYFYIRACPGLGNNTGRFIMFSVITNIYNK
jgi:hypothetical protein